MTEKILRFTASWCQPCKVLAKNLEQAQLSADIEVVDIDVHPELVDEYGIRGVPTLIRVSDKSQLSGAKTPEQIRAWFNQQ